jgi:tRNA(Met) cytidine acetyltransferase
VSIATLQPNTNQQAAIAAIERVLHGHRNRPLLLQADRGRGKSAVLGMAAQQLLQHADITILITAPRRTAVDTVFKHAQLDPADLSRLRFIAPDELVLSQPDADLLFVDEAAGIHLNLLAAILRRYRRVIFSSTVHGYEGAGRGFALRFRQLLDRYAPDWRSLELQQAVRWDDDDPLERFCLSALMLNTEPARIKTRPEHSSIERLNRNDLAQNETLLRAVFGLLVQAHYQTRPLDLRQLLDGPNLAVYALKTAAGPIAVALLATEGDFDLSLAQAIASGSRRPQGHLLAQILAYRYRCPAAAQLRFTRIVRIAVHPQWQGQGLGSYFLQGLIEQAQQNHSDMIGAVFAADPNLLRFWAKQGLQALQIGLSRNAASGLHSVALLRPLSAPAEGLQAELSNAFQQQLPYWLADPLRELDPDCVAELLRLSPQTAITLSDSEKVALASFANAERACELVLDKLCEFAQTALQQPAQIDKLSVTQQRALIAKFLQKRSWKGCADLLDLSGRREVEAVLREAVRVLLD